MLTRALINTGLKRRVSSDDPDIFFDIKRRTPPLLSVWDREYYVSIYKNRQHIAGVILRI